MDAESVSSMTRRSRPKPRPPVGGIPYSRAVTKSSSTWAVVFGFSARFFSTCATKRAFWSMGSLSSEKALPYSQPQMKYSNRSVKAGSSALRLARGLFSTG